MAEEEMEVLPLLVHLWVASEMIALEQVIVCSVSIKLRKTHVIVECNHFHPNCSCVFLLYAQYINEALLNMIAKLGQAFYLLLHTSS